MFDRQRTTAGEAIRRACPDIPDGEALILHAVDTDVTTLGPAPAKAIWLQGCSIGCQGCMTPLSWSFSAGVIALVVVVARWLRSTPGRNLVVSGGEPTEQAGALTYLLGLLGPEWIVTVYSGRYLDGLRADGRPEVAALLDRVDVLVDGPYLRARHAPLLWRGSDNQSVIDLSGRAKIGEDRPAGVIVTIDSAGIRTVGVPPEAGYTSALAAAAREMGVDLAPDRRATFPFPTFPNVAS